MPDRRRRAGGWDHEFGGWRECDHPGTEPPKQEWMKEMSDLKSVDRRSRLSAGRLLCLCLALGLVGVSTTAGGQDLKRDPAKVTGPDACGECHKSSVSAWKRTHHATTFKTLPRNKGARAMAKKLGLKRIKSESVCLSCHFTSAMKGDKVRPIAGVTCESCHGAGKDWIKPHGDYGGREVTRETESADHRRERYAKSEAAGMIRPVRLYSVAANCYGCHTVPNERLVNVGGHPAGSKFELVSWSQGEVRHNVWYSKQNDEAPAERKRMMYILGKALDLEFGLRGLAKATEKATYAKAMARRAKRAENAIKKIADVVDAPEIKEILATGAGARLKLNNAAELRAAADKVAAAARKFAEGYDGSGFAKVDFLVPVAKDFKGDAFR